MKKLFILFLTISFTFSAFGCYEAEETSSAEEATVSESSSEVPSKVVSEFVPEKVYTFLTSKYVVSTKTRLHDVTYSRRYYLVKGRVAGATMTTTLPTDKDATEYYNEAIKDFPDAVRGGSSVTVFLQGKNLGQYNNASLTKLLFLLETEGYDYYLNFDKDDFLDRYSGAVVD